MVTGGGRSHSAVEHRRSQRLATKLPGTLTGREKREIEVINLSISGCLVRCGTALDRGQVLDLEIRIGSERVRSKARVVDIALDGESIGAQPPFHLISLSFLALPCADQYMLRRFLSEEQKRSKRAS